MLFYYDDLREWVDIVNQEARVAVVDAPTIMAKGRDKQKKETKKPKKAKK